MDIQRQVRPAPSNMWGPLPPHGSRRRGSRFLRLLERLLLVVGIVALGYYVYVSAETLLYQAFENRELDRILNTAAPAPAHGDVPLATPRPRSRPANGTAIGRLEIPRLGVSAIIRTGSDARTLLRCLPAPLTLGVAPAIRLVVHGATDPFNHDRYAGEPASAGNASSSGTL